MDLAAVFWLGVFAMWLIVFGFRWSRIWRLRAECDEDGHLWQGDPLRCVRCGQVAEWRIR